MNTENGVDRRVGRVDDRRRSTSAGGRGGVRVVKAQGGGRFLLLGLGLADAWRGRKTKAGCAISYSRNSNEV